MPPKIIADDTWWHLLVDSVNQVDLNSGTWTLFLLLHMKAVKEYLILHTLQYLNKMCCILYFIWGFIYLILRSAKDYFYYAVTRQTFRIETGNTFFLSCHNVLLLILNTLGSIHICLGHIFIIICRIENYQIFSSELNM